MSKLWEHYLQQQPSWMTYMYKHFLSNLNQMISSSVGTGVLTPWPVDPVMVEEMTLKEQREMRRRTMAVAVPWSHNFSPTSPPPYPQISAGSVLSLIVPLASPDSQRVIFLPYAPPSIWIVAALRPIVYNNHHRRSTTRIINRIPHRTAWPETDSQH